MAVRKCTPDEVAMLRDRNIISRGEAREMLGLSTPPRLDPDQVATLEDMASQLALHRYFGREIAALRAALLVVSP